MRLSELTLLQYSDYFFRVLTSEISADWPKTQNFVLSCMYYRALENVDPVPFPHTNRKY